MKYLYPVKRRKKNEMHRSTHEKGGPMYPIIANLIIVIVPPLLLCWAGRRVK
jgi:hypothetical protein